MLALRTHLLKMLALRTQKCSRYVLLLALRTFARATYFCSPYVPFSKITKRIVQILGLFGFVWESLVKKFWKLIRKITYKIEKSGLYWKFSGKCSPYVKLLALRKIARPTYPFKNWSTNSANPWIISFCVGILG